MAADPKIPSAAHAPPLPAPAIPRGVWIGLGIAGVVLFAILLVCVALLLGVGLGFNLWDAAQYADDPPKVSKIAGSAPAPLPKAQNPAKDGGAKKEP